MKKQTKESVLDKIYKNVANDPNVINSIENMLTDKRGYVFKIPLPGTPVIMLFSGGLDTIAVTNILMEEYGLVVYPLYINRGLPHTRQVNRSIKFFQKYFTCKYPKLFRPVFEVKLSIPAKELKPYLLKAENDHLTINGNNVFKQGVPLQPAIYAQHALHYAKYLQKKSNTKIRTVFGAWLPANSVWFAYESFQALRSVMSNLCCVDNDFSWQFCSLPLEPELGLYLEKEDLIKAVAKYHLPVEKTWTCWKGGSKQCGCCGNCYARKEAFELAKIVDKTVYGQTLLDRCIEAIEFRYSPNR